MEYEIKIGHCVIVLKVRDRDSLSTIGYNRNIHWLKKSSHLMDHILELKLNKRVLCANQLLLALSDITCHPVFYIRVI